MIQSRARTRNHHQPSNGAKWRSPCEKKTFRHNSIINQSQDWTSFPFDIRLFPLAWFCAFYASELVVGRPSWGYWSQAVGVQHAPGTINKFIFSTGFSSVVVVVTSFSRYSPASHATRNKNWFNKETFTLAVRDEPSDSSTILLVIWSIEGGQHLVASDEE